MRKCHSLQDRFIYTPRFATGTKKDKIVIEIKMDILKSNKSLSHKKENSTCKEANWKRKKIIKFNYFSFLSVFIINIEKYAQQIK